MQDATFIGAVIKIDSKFKGTIRAIYLTTGNSQIAMTVKV